MNTLNNHRQKRRRTLALISAAALLGNLPQLASAKNKNSLRIGFQKYGTLTLLKARGT